jgi:hypothetical protein
MKSLTEGRIAPTRLCGRRLRQQDFQSPRSIAASHLDPGCNAVIPI